MPGEAIDEINDSFVLNDTMKEANKESEQFSEQSAAIPDEAIPLSIIPGITKSMIETEASLQQERVKEMNEDRKKIQDDFDRSMEKQRLNRLKFLLNRTSMYASFLTRGLDGSSVDISSMKLDPSHNAVDDTSNAKEDSLSPNHRKKRKSDNTESSDANLSHIIKQDETDLANNHMGDAFSNSNLDDLSVEEIKARQPKFFTGGLLRGYQIRGMEWLASLFENGLNGILADEMGLGKTVQCIAFIAGLREKEVLCPYLIVAPLSTLPNWVSEFQKFTPSIPVILYHGSIEERTRIRNKYFAKQDEKFPVVVTSYEIVMNDRKYLQKYHWKYLIIDEGHRIKNLNCRLIRDLKTLKSANRLLLSGTPLQNNLSELWSLLNFLLPDIFDDLEIFQSWFDFSDLEEQENRERVMSEEAKNQIVTKLHQILKPFLLRRLKADVEKDLPKKKEYVLLAPMSPAQLKLYEATLHNELRQYLSTVAPKSVKVEASAKGLRKLNRLDYKERASLVKAESLNAEEEDVPDSPSKSSTHRLSSHKLQNIIMQLRKVCNHPYLFEYPIDSRGDFLINEDIVLKSGKMMLLDRLLSELLKKNHKVLIFSQMTRMLDIIGDLLTLRNIAYYRIDGGVQYGDRVEQIHNFNTKNSVPIFLLSTRAGGLGINLTAADTVIIFDSDWNPQVDLQAQDRCHRIGQTKPVLVYRLVARNTIEVKILERASAKRKLEKLVIHKKRFRDVKKADLNIDISELAEILEDEEGEHIALDSSKLITDEELNRILDRSDEAFESKQEGASFKVFETKPIDSQDLLSSL